MNIVFAMLLSIAIKGISAIVEISIQMLLTNQLGVSEYGSYTFYISLIEGAFFALISGSIKLNTFYLSTPTSSIAAFKRKYTYRFVTPLVALIIICFILLRNPYGVLAGIILFAYYFALDTSSVFFSRGNQLPALLGEYLFGRLALLFGVIATIKLNMTSGLLLLGLYGLQYVTMLLWFSLHKGKLVAGIDEVEVPVRKLLEYQVSDAANSLINYSPIILQYIHGGAFTAGFAGIISLVKRFINFVAGPTVKVFLPEFSRLYKNEERDKLEKTYLMIVRIQMVFIGTIGMALIGFPNLILHMFSPELEQYGIIFTATAISLLLIAGIGPVAGILQMTGNERICNRNQWMSICIMLIVCFVLRKEPLFAFYGLCVQAVAEGGMKYFSLCRWFGKNIVPIKIYILLWLPVALLRITIDRFGWQYSYIAMFICVLIVFAWNLWFAMQDKMIKTAIIGKLRSFRKSA